MRIVRVLRSTPSLLCLGAFGLLLAAGCGGGNPNTKTAAPATTQAQQDAERDARVKAFGKAAIESGTSRSGGGGKKGSSQP